MGKRRKKRKKRRVYIVARPLEAACQLRISAISESKLALCHWGLLFVESDNDEAKSYWEHGQEIALRGTLFELVRIQGNKNTYDKIEEFCVQDWKKWGFILISEAGETECSDKMLSNKGKAIERRF
jgi:hypothetical protein